MKLLVRLLVMVGGSLAYAAAAPAVLPGDDGLGTGLLYFLLVMCVACAWAVWDGYHVDSLVEAGVGWVVVALAVGLLGPFRIWFTEGRDDAALRSDLVALTPFLALLVLVPAAGGLMVGRARRPGSNRTTAR